MMCCVKEVVGFALLESGRPNSLIRGLDSFRYGNTNGVMARAATTTDAFNAIAEPRRREILALLARRESSVGELVDSMGVAQPVVSKHLRVLREVGLVQVRVEGRHHWYRLNGHKLKPVYNWVRTFERYWAHQLQGVKEHAEAKARGKKS